MGSAESGLPLVLLSAERVKNRERKGDLPGKVDRLVVGLFLQNIRDHRRTVVLEQHLGLGERRVSK